MYITLLTLHITGAVVMAIAGITSLVAVGLNKSQWYQKFAYAIGGLGIAQLISGLAMSFFTSTSMLVVCSKLLAYLLITIVLELVLLRKMAVSSQHSPESANSIVID